MFAEGNARRWLRAVQVQGERCITAAEAHRAAVRGMAESQTPMIDARGMLLCEEHLFLIALGKALDWLKELVKVAPVHRPALERLKQGTPHARDLRNMREHGIQYFRGDGREQPSFIHELPGPGSTVLARVDASSTLVLGAEYLLGGRLDLHRTVALANETLGLLPDPPFGWLREDAESAPSKHGSGDSGVNGK
jgi:hypothetical protein